MMAPAPVRYAAEYEDPKFPSSSCASIGARLSLSFERSTATPAVYGVPMRSNAGARPRGAMRSDSGVAGPRAVKLLIVCSQSVVPKNVKQSAVEEPTEKTVLAVEGGE